MLLGKYVYKTLFETLNIMLGFEMKIKNLKMFLHILTYRINNIF